MPLGGVIFDWDGVVINSATLHKKSWEMLADELVLPLPINHFELGYGKKNEVIIPTKISKPPITQTIRSI